jgi:DNA-binding response OmpR family regulator
LNPSSAVHTLVGILVYGSDELLLGTRTMVLENAGFQVFSAISSDGAESIMKSGEVALVVLCHSLSEQQCEAALDFAKRQRPALNTLVLTASGSPCSERTTGAVLSAFDGPRKLVETVQDLLDCVQSKA